MKNKKKIDAALKDLTSSKDLPVDEYLKKADAIMALIKPNIDAMDREREKLEAHREETKPFAAKIRLPK